MFVFIWPEKKSNDRVTQNRFCVDELSDESISCSQAMCLWTSTFVVKPMLVISTHTGCCGVAILWICAPIDLPKPRRQSFRVQVRCIFPSYPLFCAQEQSCDFLWCGQEEREVARNRTSWRFFVQLRLRYVSGKVVTSTAVHGVRSRACGCSSGQRRPLCRGLLRDGGEFDFPLVCMLV